MSASDKITLNVEGGIYAGFPRLWRSSYTGKIEISGSSSMQELENKITEVCGEKMKLEGDVVYTKSVTDSGLKDGDLVKARFALRMD